MSEYLTGSTSQNQSQNSTENKVVKALKTTFPESREQHMQ